MKFTVQVGYDGRPVYDAVAARRPDADVLIALRSTAVSGNSSPGQQDRHIATIEEHGRRGWQTRIGYVRRSLLATAMFCCKTIIGRRLHTRTLSNRQTEAKITCGVRNRMTSLGMPVSVRVK